MSSAKLSEPHDVEKSYDEKQVLLKGAETVWFVDIGMTAVKVFLWGDSKLILCN